MLGRLLGIAFAICFLTGLISHYLQHPPGWLVDALPARPVWGYRLTQGLHVATGVAAIPLLLAKLWTVYPRLFAWPPMRSMAHGLERAAVAVLVAGAVFEPATGLLNSVQWYPWPFPFIQVHWAVAWLVIGALLLHVAAKGPQIAAHWRRRSPGTEALPAEDLPDRRALLVGVGVAVGAVTVTTVGQSVTPLGRVALLAPRSPQHGPQGLPINRTAAAAGMSGFTGQGWRLALAGPRPCELSLDELRALPQYDAELPISCVEGWSKSARWTGVRVRDLLDRLDAPRRSGLRVISMERQGSYRVTEMSHTYADDPLTLLALRLNGEVLSLDHGFPARIIAPNRPGVLQTKWVSRLEVL